MPETQEQVTENLLEKETTPLDIKKEESKAEVKSEELKAEDTKKEEKPTPPEGSKRWNDVYRKAKENERKVRQLEHDMQLLRDHNQKLVDLKSRELEIAGEAQARSTKDQIKSLRIKMKKAENELDWDNYVEYESQVEELRSRVEKKAVMEQPDISRTKDADIKKDTQKAVAKFTKETPWFDESSDDYDEVMADAAIMMDQKLMKSWDGTVDDRFDEVKKKIEERFSYKKNGKGSLPSVGGADNSLSGKSKTELTSDQKRVVSMLFPNDKDAEKKYIEQLQIIRKG